MVTGGSKTTRRYAMGRRRRNTLIGVVLIFLAAAVWVGRSCLSRYSLVGSITGVPTQADDFSKYHGKEFSVVKVVDGDTLDIDVPDGEEQTTRIRLWGIDTPETYPPDRAGYFGAEASEFAEDLAFGKTVRVYLAPRHRTRGYYGRLLAYVQLPSGDFLNEVLVSEGYAYADPRFKHPYYNKYEQLQAAARREGKGLWAKVRREQLPEWLRERKSDLLRAR